jgi:tetratricopeptide (TPR) repeat protein
LPVDFKRNNKIGRNDPCPCGSGKKYKVCCQQKQAISTPRAAASPDITKVLRDGWIYYQHGRFGDAEAACQGVLKIKPKQADALHLLGIIALQNGDIDKAILLIDRAININTTNPEYHNNLGFALHEQGKLDKAAECYAKALKMQPEYGNALYNLHALMLSGENIESATRSLKKLVELQPNDMDARVTLGVLLDYSGDNEAASRQFDIARQGANLYRSRLDAWEYLRSKGAKNLPMIGSMIDTFKLAMNSANHEGLVLEFGVRFGNSIRQIAALAGAQQIVHGFDSFEGLPEVWHHEPKGSYTTKGEIPSVPDNVRLHVGWFENTLPEFLQKYNGNARFINIDCDIYSSTSTVLNLLAPRIVPGTVIVFDEYIGNEHWREDEFKAFQEAVAVYGWSYEYLCFSIFTKQVAVRILK